MDFLKSYFFKNEPLISWAFLSSKLDSPVIKTLERPFFYIECLSNVLITKWSNFDERECSTDQRFILKEITSLKIHTLTCTIIKKFYSPKYFPFLLDCSYVIVMPAEALSED